MGKKQKLINIIIIFLIVLVSAFTGYYFGRTKEIIDYDGGIVNGTSTRKVIINDRNKTGNVSGDIDFDLFWDVWDTMKQEYVNRPINEEDLFYGSIEGMVASLRDPYSVFLRPKISKEFSDELSGEFQGIGAEIGIKNDILTIISPLPNTPAERAGLKSGDKILAIDDVDTHGMHTDEAVNIIRGEKGTIVALMIQRKEAPEPFKVEVVRDEIKFDSVRWEFRDDGLAYVRILHFNTDTRSKFSEAVDDIVKKDPKGIILDLRSNPGGFLDAAIEVASEWVEDGVIVTEYYSEEKKIEHESVGKAILKDYKSAVLINGGSASGSEIVAGALKDYKKATLIGETSFGKGSVQSLVEFDDGSSLKLTVAKWLTPAGHCINEKGVEPDEKIELTAEDYNNDKDPQMNRAVGILLGE